MTRSLARGGRAPILERHLPGQHNQKSHAGGRWGAEPGAQGGGGTDPAGGPGGTMGSRAAAKAEDRIRTLEGGEIGVAFNPATGKEVLSKMQMGDPDGPGPRIAGVDFSDAEIAQMRGSVFTHNHPDGLTRDKSDPRRAGNSFSDSDVAFAAGTDLTELRVVTPVYRMSLRPGPAGWGDPADVLLSAGLTSGSVRRDFEAKIKAGSMTIADAEVNHWHEVWVRVSEARGWDYQRLVDPMPGEV